VDFVISFRARKARKGEGRRGRDCCGCNCCRRL